MTSCDMCGKSQGKTGVLVDCVIEGSRMRTCPACASFGRIVPGSSSVAQVKKPARTTVQQVIESVVSDSAVRIHTARDAKKMTQKEFAAFLQEKESLVHKLETKGFSPSIDLARKLEKLLGIVLIEVETENVPISQSKRAEGLTIGDFIKL